MPKQTKREESGVQLLARLGSRPDLSSLDPDIFGCQSLPSSSHTQSTPSKGKSLTSTPGHLVEIFGPEGAGKTELALHYLACTCLPQSWNDVHIGGVGAKALIIDTDFKFSVLRFAVVLEKQILALCQKESEKEKSTSCDAKPSKSFSEAEHVRSKMDSGDRNVELKGDENSRINAARTGIGDEDLKQDPDSNHIQKKRDKSRAECDPSARIQTQASTSAGNSIKLEDGKETQEEKKSGNKTLTCLSLQDLECIVHESLERVQVVKPNSVQQLFMSLLSLEITLTSDLQTVLVLLDSVTAFFWEDRLAENMGNLGRVKGSAAAGGMTHVAGVVGRLVSQLGLTVIMTKAPLVRGASTSSTAAGNRKRKWRDDKDEVDSGTSHVCNASASAIVEGGVVEEDHIEFLGKAWVNLNPVRIVLTEENPIICRRGSHSSSIRTWEQGSERRITSAICSSWPSKRQFTFIDDALQFV